MIDFQTKHRPNQRKEGKKIMLSEEKRSGRTARMIGWKILQPDGYSLNRKTQYALPVGEAPGPWQEVPGNGAYVAHTAGLYSGGSGPLLVEIETEGEVIGTVPPAGVRTWRRVRVLRVLDRLSIPPGAGGDLDLRGTGITVLPEGLHVGGGLDLRDTGITVLPEGLHVGGDLDLQDTGITALPEGQSRMVQQ